MCVSWQHTPCAGYYTNKDKRIPEKYVCYSCQHRGNKKLLKNLQELASLRRAISVVYSEGLEGITWLSKRLGIPNDYDMLIMYLCMLDCGVAKASKLIRRMESEGLVTKPNSQAKSFTYIVHKTPEAKERIRYYFGLDLNAFPELKGLFNKQIKVSYGVTKLIYSQALLFSHRHQQKEEFRSRKLSMR